MSSLCSHSRFIKAVGVNSFQSDLRNVRTHVLQCEDMLVLSGLPKNNMFLNIQKRRVGSTHRQRERETESETETETKSLEGIIRDCFLILH